MNLRQILAAAHSINDHIQISFNSTPDEKVWTCRITIGMVNIFESAPGPPEVVIEEACQKLLEMASRMMKTLKPGASPIEED